MGYTNDDRSPRRRTRDDRGSGRRSYDNNSGRRSYDNNSGRHKEFRDLSLEERERMIKSEARRRYVPKDDVRKKKKNNNTGLIAGVIACVTLAVLIVVIFMAAHISGKKSVKRSEGIASFEMGDYEAAKKSFNDSLDEKQWFCEDMDMDTLFYLGETYIRLNDFSSAMSTYQKIVFEGDDKQKEKAEEYINLTTALMNFADKNYDAAIVSLNAMVKEGNSDMAIYLASCYSELGQYDSMLEAYAVYLKDHPLDSYIAYQLSTYYLENDNLDYALKYITDGIAIEGEYIDKLYFNEVVYYEKTNDLATAYSKISALCEKHPEVEEYQKEKTFLETRLNP